MAPRYTLRAAARALTGAALLLAAAGPSLAQTVEVPVKGPVPITMTTTPERSWTFTPAEFAPYDGKIVQSIQLTGNKVTKDYVVRREIHTQVGLPFSHDVLGQDVQRLQNIQVFSSLEVVPAGTDSTVTLLFALKEMPALLVYPALSYTDQNGWSYGAGLSSINLTGRNISATGKALFGGQTTYSFSASDPWMAGNHLSAKATVAHLERFDQFDDFEQTDNYVTPWVGTYLGRFGRAGATVSWLQVRSDVPGKTLNPDDVDNMYYTGFYLQYDSRTSVRQPDDGWYAQVQELHTGGFLGGDGDFWSSMFDLRKYSRTFGSQVVVLGAFAQFQSGAVGVDVPEYMQFHMGGANSIRGYDLDSLGTKLYGKNQFIATIEYSFQLRPIREYKVLNWTFALGLQAALFVDNGIAWNQGAQFNTETNRVGGGIGLRVLVPGMQMVRFDFAQGEGGQFRFMFGTGSKFDAQTKRIR